VSVAVHDDVWDRLSRSASTPQDAMRRMALATADAGGADVRMVVLRDASAERRTLAFHTDARSPKIAAMAADPRVGLLFWDPCEQLQLRCRARAQVVADGDAADAAWAGLSADQRTLYDATRAPGDDAEGAATPPTGRAAFRLVSCRVSTIDRLSLRDGRQERVRIDYAGVAPRVAMIAP